MAVNNLGSSPVYIFTDIIIIFMGDYKLSVQEMQLSPKKNVEKNGKEKVLEILLQRRPLYY